MALYFIKCLSVKNTSTNIELKYWINEIDKLYSSWIRCGSKTFETIDEEDLNYYLQN